MFVCFVSFHCELHLNYSGTQNNGGQAVFDCVPAEGVITAGKYLNTFSPTTITSVTPNPADHD